MEMQDIEKIAVGSVIKDKELKELKRALTASSSNEIDVLVRVKGLLKKGVNGEAPVTASLPKIKMLVDSLQIISELASGMNEVQRKAFLARLAVNEDRELDSDRDQEITEDVVESFMKRFTNGNSEELKGDRKDAFDATWKKVAGTTTKPVSGRVTFKGTIEKSIPGPISE